MDWTYSSCTSRWRAPAERALTEFRYDDSGLRVWTRHRVDGDVNGTWDSTQTKDYLFDPANPTGHEHVQVETTRDGGGTVVGQVVYTVGGDVIGQADVSTGGAGEAVFHLYDGHGSTRALTDAVAARVIDAGDFDEPQSFHMCGYGDPIQRIAS